MSNYSNENYQAKGKSKAAKDHPRSTSRKAKNEYGQG